jgi:hypothetical protein
LQLLDRRWPLLKALVHEISQLRILATPKRRVQCTLSTTLHSHSSQSLILPPHSILRLAISRDHSKRDSSVPAAPGCVCTVHGVWQTWPIHHSGDSFAPAISFISVDPSQCSCSSRTVLHFVVNSPSIEGSRIIRCRHVYCLPFVFPHFESQDCSSSLNKVWERGFCTLSIQSTGKGVLNIVRVPRRR